MGIMSPSEMDPGEESDGSFESDELKKETVKTAHGEKEPSVWSKWVAAPGKSIKTNMRRLFGSKKSDEKKAPNPYAEQAPTSDAYLNQSAHQANHYAQVSPQPGRQGLPKGPRQGLPNGPRLGASRQSSSISEDYNNPPPQYTQSPNLSSGSPQLGSGSPQPSSGSSPGGRYGKEKFGASGGYGASRYDNGPGSASASPVPQRPGGYGGLGDPEERLWGDRYNERVSPPGQQTPSYDPAVNGDAQPNRADGFDGDYGGYGEQRELTEEEIIGQKKGEIVNELRATNDTVDRTLSMAYQALELQTASNQQLIEQDEVISSAHKSINKALLQNRIGLNKTKELKSAQGWVSFRPSGKKLDMAEEEELEQQRQEAAEREAVRKWEYDNRKLGQSKPKPRELGVATRANNKNFEFEDDTGEQEELNEQISDKVAALQGVMSQVNQNAHTTAEILARSNIHIDSLTDKSERARDEVVRNEMKLYRAVR
ncbi:hypothetical protein B0H63DRAFT_484972 [Podospora didyma]|uniref:t-SNARE coiled-coil homology domain-containing protein n=1 Tax=Podospora didyma TaxID=330526 RepID=A0AAE0N6D3_9PEZI|nr:hypothetical protein B0H63DRAFT_484972 [Podospora didyma]